MVVKSEMDIIRTIDDEEEVENLSEDSDAEVEVSDKMKFTFLNIFSKNLFILVSTNKAKATKAGIVRKRIQVRLICRRLQQGHVG